MRKLGLSLGKRRTHPYIRNGKTTWANLTKKLLDFKITGETFAEYMDMTPDLQADIKDVGYLVGGPFEGKTRKKSELRFRSIITLDVDHCQTMSDCDKLLAAYSGFELVLHSTHKHAGKNPRLRLVFPLTRDVTPFEYEPLARNIADWFGMDYFDDTTFEVSRIMYWPSRSSDGAEVAKHVEGAWVNPDEWLENADDFLDWPRSSRVTSLRQSGGEAADPLTKTGWIGAFCRTYDIHSAITQYLPDTFEPTEWDNRYRPIGATGPAGAIVYDDVFLYSHHENPEDLFNKNVNAFDLVRIVKFGDSTAQEIDNEVPTMQHQSMKDMAKLCASDPAVVGNSELGDMDDDEDEDEPVRGEDANEAERKAARGPTVDVFMNEINDTGSLTSEECDVFLPRIAQYEPHEVEQLLKVLQGIYPVKPGIQSLRDTVKRMRQQLAGRDEDDQIADIERELVDEMLAEHYKGGRWIRRIGKVFWIYRHGVWRMIGDEPIRGKLQKTIVRIREERPEDVVSLVAAVGDNKTTSLVSALWAMLTVRLAETSETDDDPLMLMRRITEPVVNCLNCEIHLNYAGEMKVRKHNPDHFYTLQVGTEYDVDAECPEWDRFMEMVFSECIDPEDMQRHLEELGGYIINMSRWNKNWVLFHGPTDTGKSTILDVFKELLGPSCLAMEMGRFGMDNSFADSSLLGKLLLADDDFDRSAQLPDGFIKKISEEKRITSDIKFGSPITFQARCLPLICANHWPVSRDVSDAFRERAMVLEFKHRIKGSEKSDQRRDLMLLELPGILNKFIAGLVRLRVRGSWNTPIDAAISHEIWETNSNQSIRYVRERLTSGDRVKPKSVWQDYLRWAPGKGMRMSQHTFYERLEQVIGSRVLHEGMEYFKGWVLQPPDELDFGGSIDDDAD